MTTPYERLMAEAIPTRPRPRPTPKPQLPAGPIKPWTPEEQDAHWADLCDAVGTPGAERPHLRLIADHPTEDPETEGETETETETDQESHTA